MFAHSFVDEGPIIESTNPSMEGRLADGMSRWLLNHLDKQNMATEHDNERFELISPSDI